MINTIGYVDVQPLASFDTPPLTRIPSYPDLPMEDVFPRETKTDIGEVFLREVGAGRVAYFPGDIDHTFWQILHPDHGRILANVVRWAANEPDVVSVDGPGIVDVCAWEGSDYIAIHLVNLTNPMMMKGPIRDTYAIGQQRVTVQIPRGRSLRQVRLLVSSADAPHTVSDQRLSLTVPSIADHELIAIEI
jgi:hypothetical protein